ncbi:MAG: hypothetical protein IGS38_05020 [Synechococcales cyanobacterium M58_A2018_015]|nr:hypothetical protein [Synechococcales cyanobacterium M58_A2018_015]
METLLINESLICTFQFWREGKVLKGMRFRNHLFRHVAQFSHQERYQAFDLAWKLCQRDHGAIVTTSALNYTVWLNLCSPTTGDPLLAADASPAAPAVR